LKPGRAEYEAALMETPTFVPEKLVIAQLAKKFPTGLLGL
jgi:hypothetical protein